MNVIFKKNHFTRLYNHIINDLNLEKKEFSVEFVSVEEIKYLNRKYRGIDSKTDVISLEYNDPVFLGEIYISSDVVLENSTIYGCTFAEEMDRTFIHAVLHLLGYDHKDSLNKNEKMFIIQENILNRFK